MKPKIKVALMSYPMDNRSGKGTALYTRKLIEHMLSDERFEFTLVHYDRVDDPLYTRAREILMPELSLPFATRFVRQLFFFWKYRNDRFDIIHWFQPRLYPFFWLAPAKRLVVTAHGAGDITAPGAFPFSRRVFNFLMVHFNNRLDAIIGDSEFGREEIIGHYRADEKRVHTILLAGGEGYTHMTKDEARRALVPYGIAHPYILDVSRHDAHKNIDALIDAYEIMRSDFPERKEQLVIVGGKGNCHEKTYAKAGSSLYKDDILLVEFVKQEDLNAFYSGAELFVFPSLNEGFGLPILEAFAAGVPVITSNITSMPEIAGDAARVVNPSDAHALASAMAEVLSDAQVRHGMIEKGTARSKEFTWKSTAARTLELYQSLTAV